MIHDLVKASEDAHVTTDVCIVGAGTAGLYLAHRLRSSGLDVVVLEAGSLVARSPMERDQQCVQRGIPYRGAESGRSFGLGGTSVLWGGQLLALTDADVAPRPHCGFPGWPVTNQDILGYVPSVLSDLGLAGQAPGEVEADASLIARYYAELSSFEPGFNLRLSAWLPFARRNFAHAFRGMVERDRRVAVWLNAHVVALDACEGEGGWKVRSIEARTEGGRRVSVGARIFVLAAGALETTRLLLNYDETTSGSISQAGAPLGRHFADHLSVTCGQFQCHDWTRFNQGVAPVFTRGIMRTPRLEVDGTTQAALGLSPLHVRHPWSHRVRHRAKRVTPPARRAAFARPLPYQAWHGHSRCDADGLVEVCAAKALDPPAGRRAAAGGYRAAAEP